MGVDSCQFILIQNSLKLFWDDFDIGPEHGCLAQAFRGQI